MSPVPYAEGEAVREPDSAIWDFPLRFESDGDITRTTFLNSVKNNLRNSVMVLYRGIPLRTFLGSQLPLLPFDPMDDVTKDLIGAEIQRATTIGEPRAMIDPAIRIVESNNNTYHALASFLVRSVRSWGEVSLDLVNIDEP